MTGLVVDTSAIVAIMKSEPGWQWLTRKLQEHKRKAISAPNALELSMVLEAHSPKTIDAGRRSLQQAEIQIEMFDADLTYRATHAWRRFGKGRHPAALNFGDCCTYALAERSGWPILCVGDDFRRTDMATLTPPEEVTSE